MLLGENMSDAAADSLDFVFRVVGAFWDKSWSWAAVCLDKASSISVILF